DLGHEKSGHRQMTLNDQFDSAVGKYKKELKKRLEFLDAYQNDLVDEKNPNSSHNALFVKQELPRVEENLARLERLKKIYLEQMINQFKNLKEPALKQILIERMLMGAYALENVTENEKR